MRLLSLLGLIHSAELAIGFPRHALFITADGIVYVTADEINYGVHI